MVYIDGTADLIQLTDKEPFCSPAEFTAEEIVYTRSFDYKESGKGSPKGWEAVVMPFTPDKITAYNKNNTLVELKSYKALGDDWGNYIPIWVNNFDEDNTSVAKIEANVPYLMCVPNNSSYDDMYNIIGDVVFSASKSKVPATATPGITSSKPASGTLFSLTHTFNNDVVNADNIYVLDEAGSYFVRSTETQIKVNPFDGYLTITPQSVASAPRMISVDFKVSTSVIDRLMDKSALKNLIISVKNNEIIITSAVAKTVDIYSVDGRKIRTENLTEGTNVISGMERGMYIIEGEKILF